jgi:uncharacterized membrane protein
VRPAETATQAPDTPRRHLPSASPAGTSIPLRLAGSLDCRDNPGSHSGKTMAKRQFYIKRYLITGLLTFVPLWLTWMVFKFVFGLLSEVSSPLVASLVSLLGSTWAGSGELLGQPWMISLIAFVITLISLYLVGFAANFVLGRRLIDGMENLIQRIPIVHSIYGGTKKLMSVLQNKPSGTQRVVMINFPSPELKSIGFVTRIFRDAGGRELAAVYVPTTPNPTGGYLEIVPVELLTATDWSVDQAMAFLLSAGAVGDDTLPFTGKWNTPPTDRLVTTPDRDRA